MLPITFFAFYKPRLVFTSMSGFSEYMLLLMYAVSSDLVSLLICNVSFVYNAYFAFIMILLNENDSISSQWSGISFTIKNSIIMIMNITNYNKLNKI